MTEQPYSKRHLMLGLAAVPFSFFYAYCALTRQRIRIYTTVDDRRRS